jgi:hypothetical protein
MKSFSLTIALITGLFTLANSGSAEVVRSHSKLWSSDKVVQDGVSTLGPGASVFGAWHQSGEFKGNQDSSGLGGAFSPFLSQSSIQSSFTAVNVSGRKRGWWFKEFGDRVNTPTAFLGGDPPAAAPEPASTAFVLSGLFGAGLLLARRFRARQS